MAITVKSVMEEAARECSIGAVSNWISSPTGTVLELRDMLSQTADELLDRLDLPYPFTRDTVITGDGSEEYDLPDDFLRMTRDDGAVYETTTTRRRGIPVHTNGEWTHLKQIGTAGGARYYRVQGSEDFEADPERILTYSIGFYRPLESGSSVTVSYMSKNWIANGSTLTTTWQDEADYLLLPKMPILAGVVWRFRRRKGLAFADRLAEYESYLTRMINDSRGIRRVNMGGPRMVKNPMDVPVPDYIPPA